MGRRGQLPLVRIVGDGLGELTLVRYAEIGFGFRCVGQRPSSRLVLED